MNFIVFLSFLSFPFFLSFSLYHSLSLSLFNQKVINYDSPKGIKVQFKKSKPAISKLIINNVQNSDSCNYSCVPSNADPAYIAVHVLNEGDYLAAMQHGKRSAESFVNQADSNLSIKKIFLFLAFYKICSLFVIQI